MHGTALNSSCVFCLQMELPADKPRMMPGVMTPDNVLEAVNAGIDIFDTAYLFELFLDPWLC